MTESEDRSDRAHIRAVLQRRLFGRTSEPSLIGDRYEITGVIGRGGLGRVYRARDVRLHRDVAIKLVAADLSDPEPQRLFREALTLARLSHPNIVAVHDVGRIGLDVYIAMELVDGTTLETWLSRPQRSWREIVAKFIAAGRALEAAHRAGLAHGDFKATNVMIDRQGEVRVLDFGLAREMGRTARIEGEADGGWDGVTRLGGTPGYMPPEQYRGRIDERTDQFAFCVALFVALYDRFPFDWSREGIDEASLRTQPARRSRGNRGLPRSVRATILRGLAPEPSGRFATMGALLEGLAPPRRARWPVVLAGSLVALAIGSSLRAEPCDSAEDDATADAWSDARRDRLAVTAGARANVDVAALDPAIGDWQARWVALRRESCEAHRRGEIGDALYDLRLSCLRRSRDTLDYLLERLEDDATVDPGTVIDTVAELTILTCDDDQGLLAGRPTGTIDWDLAQDLLVELRRAHVHLLLGDPQTQLAMLLELERRAPDPKSAPGMTLWVTLHLGAALARAGRFDEAEARLRRAMLEARAWGRWPEAEGLVLARLADAISNDPTRADEALLLAEQAVATLEGAPSGDTVLSAARLALARAQYAAHRPAEALATLDRAESDGPPAAVTDGTLETRLWAAEATNLRGLLLEALARPDDAEAVYRRGIALADAVGRPSLEQAHLLNNLGLLLRRMGRTEAAIDALHESARIKDRLGLPGDVATTLMNVGNAYLGQGRAAEAIATYDEAVEHLRRAPDTETEALIRFNRAIARFESGQHGQAQRDYDFVVTELTRTEPADAARLYPALVGRGSARLAGQDDAGARDDYEWALRIEPADANAYDRAELRFGLARALPAQGRVRARELAAQARQDAAGANAPALERDIVAWLDASHPPSISRRGPGR